MSTEERRTLVHADDPMMKAPFRLAEAYVDGAVPYRVRDDGKEHCDFCGSLSPTALAEMLKAGAGLSQADMKYGWPHKFYVERASWGKFYTVHLVDATPEERDIIERAMGLHIVFDGDRVGWRPYSPPSTASTEKPNET